MTDDAARDRASWPDGGHVPGDPQELFRGSAATQPQSGPPVSGGPYSGPPVSGGPYPGHSVSGTPYPAQSSGGPYGSPYGQDQFGLDAAPMSGGPAFLTTGRRIEPSPPANKGKTIMIAAAGLVAGLLIGGTGAFFLGRGTADKTEVAPAAQEPAVITELVAANKAKFANDTELAALAEPWLDDMSGCAADTDSNGPKLDKGQKTHVLCREGGMYLHFVAYESADAKSADMGYRQQVALNSAAYLPGAEQSGRKLGGITGVSGNYVEYATRSGKNPALCGVYWNRDNTDAAVYVDVICDSLGGSWDPLRAVWQRHS